MKTLIIILLTIFVISVNSFAQVLESWRKSYTTLVESRLIASRMDNSGNIIAGTSRSVVGEGANYVIIKFNSNGDTLWRNEYHSYGDQHDHLFDVYTDANGNIYATGLSTNYNAPFQTTRTIKYSPTGNILWIAVDTTNTTMSTNGVSKEGYIAEGPDGDIYVCTNKQSKLYVIRYSPSGTAVWKKLIPVPVIFPNRVMPRAFQINNSGLYIFTIGLDNNYTEHILGMKCNFAGDTLWTYLERFENNFHEAARGMTIDAAGNVYFLTEIFENFFTSRIGLTKSSSSGSIAWEKIYGAGLLNQKNEPTDVKTDNNSNIYITAAQTNASNNNKYDGVTIKYSQTGDSVWSRRIRGFNNEDAKSNHIIIDNNNFLYVAGQYPMQNSSSQFLQKYSPSGDSLWNFNIQLENYWSIGRNIFIDQSGSAILASNRQNGIMLTKFSNATSVNRIGTEIPDAFSLSQNFPNPFNPKTIIHYDLKKASQVTLKIYDSRGLEVAVLTDEKQGAGSYAADWNASGFSSGVYFYKLTVDGFTATKKMILTK